MADPSIQARLKGWLTAAWRFVSSAPLTYAWLIVLLITTIIQHSLSRRELHTLLIHQSTNIHELATDPLEVLFTSLFWIDGRYWTPYLVLFTLFLAPAEQWLGEIRWLTVGLTAHVGATYLSEGMLYLAIQHHLAPERLVHARDIGVSYFMVGVIAVLAYRIALPWRWGYLADLGHRLHRPTVHPSDIHCDRALLGDLHRPVVLSDGPSPQWATSQPGQALSIERCCA